MIISEHYLRHIEDIISEHPGLSSDGEDGIKGISNIDKEWFINGDMLRNFGNGKKYRFVELDEKETDDYTHMCLDDEFYYDENWFADSCEEIPKEPKPTEPVTIEIKDLEIPE